MLDSWIVAQIGSREHYGVPRALHKEQHLDLFVTDFWMRFNSQLLSKGPSILRSMNMRRHPDIPSNKVRSFNLRAITEQLRSGHLRTVTEQSINFMRYGSDFACRVNQVLSKKQLDFDRHAFFGFSRECLETLEMLKGRNITTVIDQISPGRVEEYIITKERQLWPGWEANDGVTAEEAWQRVEREWELASIILVNSQWSKSALIEQGVSGQKIIIVPLAYENPIARHIVRRSKPANEPLRVLWLGTVCLRKGIQYLLEAAKLLLGENIRISVAGPFQITAEALSTTPPNLSFIGRATRDQLQQIYFDADVFVLPTLSDGFAVTQLEAMAHGLPVITTPRCGDVVQSGLNGLIVPPGDGDALARAILKIANDRQLLENMSRAAVRRAGEFTLGHYADSLLSQVSNRP